MQLTTVNGTDSFPTSGCINGLATKREALQTRPAAFVTWTSSRASLSRVLLNLARTITFCPADIRMGFYHPSNLFLFMSENPDSMRDLVFSDKEVRRHERVAMVSQGDKGVVIIERFDVYDQSQPIKVTGAYKKGRLLMSDLFRPFPMKVSKLVVFPIDIVVCNPST